MPGIKKLIVAAFAAAFLLSQAVSSAAILISASGPGIPGPTFEGQVQFPDFNNFQGPGTITPKNVTGLGSIDWTVTYAGSDIDFPTGLRWGETITNNTPFDWTDFHFGLSDGIFLTQQSPGGGVPGIADIGPLVAPVIVDLDPGVFVTNPDGSQTKTYGDGTEFILSASQTEIWILFGNPILPGQSFDVWIPIQNLDPNGGQFTLNQHASVIPEPTTIVVWSLLGMCCIGYRCRRKRQEA